MGFFKDLTRGLFGSDQPVKRAEAFNREQAARAESTIREGLEGIPGFFSDSDDRYSDLLQTLLGTIESGGRRSESFIRGGTRNAVRNARDDGERTKAESTSSMVNRGLYNSSAAINAQQGIDSRTTDRISNIYANEAGQLASNAQRQTGLAANALSSIGSLYAGSPERQLAATLGTRSNLANALLSVQATAQPTQGLLGAAGPLLGGAGRLAGGLGALGQAGGLGSVLGFLG